MPKFQPILDRALARKNGQQGLDALISEPLPALRFLEQTDDRFLAMMTK
ncbi:MAG TPA: 3-methyladenine DNA glycosylase, partial [Oceanospirillaceae bacterium]|nr:3-methyladenine DNA glycosylase [Oceanospirillaceae bacterium]